MSLTLPTPLLGGLSPAAFMRRHWQKAPLLVRQALPGVQPPLPRSALHALAADADMETRLVECREGEWRVRHGPLAPRSLPPLGRAGWTLLVQGLDLQVPAARALLEHFRFLPDARVDDLMVSWASPGGGVGPHVDDYDVFLIQLTGRRRWRVGRVPHPQWVPAAPLKRLAAFEPEFDWVLEPGDLLYLPPRWGHDGVAEGGDCMTASAGFRVPSAGGLSRDLLGRLASEDGPAGRLYRDAGQAATAQPAAVPPALLRFAQAAVARELAQPLWLERALGESLTEPKPHVCFAPDEEAARRWQAERGALALRLSPRSRMLYDEHHVFLNGEAFRAAGDDARAMQALADQRGLDAAVASRLSRGAKALVQDWLAAGWVEADAP